MAQFSFGETIAGSVGSALDRQQRQGQMNRRFALNKKQLAERVRQNKFDRQMDNIAMRLQQKQQDLAEDQFTEKVAQRAMELNIQRDREDRLQEQLDIERNISDSRIDYLDARSDYYESRAEEADRVGSGAVPDSSAINANLRARVSRRNEVQERLSELRNMMSTIDDTGQVPEDISDVIGSIDMSGDMVSDQNRQQLDGRADPVQAMRMVQSQIVNLEGELGTLSEDIQRLNDLSGLDLPSDTNNTSGNNEEGVLNDL